jgi:hypothetical protein
LELRNPYFKETLLKKMEKLSKLRNEEIKKLRISFLKIGKDQKQNASLDRNYNIFYKQSPDA